MKYASSYLLAAVALFGFAHTANAAKGDNLGDTQQCIRLSSVDETPVIDDRTIAVRMKGGGYKRIDLVNKCSGLKMQGGFSHSTSTNDLCTTDPLRVLEPVGATCLIDKIVTIDAAEYKELRKRK
jgi:hypothetical protein